MVEEEKLLHWLGLGERRRLHTDKQIMNGNERTESETNEEPSSVLHICIRERAGDIPMIQKPGPWTLHLTIFHRKYLHYIRFC